MTFAGLFAASKLKDYISQLYPNSYKENVWIIVPNNLIPTIIYACMMIIMKPVAEELFYRKAIIRFGDKKKMILLTVASLLICALSRAHGPVAIMQWILMSLPVTIAYIATKNIYIPIMAHVIFEFWDNTYEIVYSLGRIFFR
ncbi:MAG: CPBP family intramembrane metalloprotease [Butyrivibrio sp.]|nr:CPBP family intramembrane metalloprotease [Butyrivibrio sp.]